MFYLAAESPSFPSKARFPNQTPHHESASGLEQHQPEPGAVPTALASRKPQLPGRCHVWPFGGPTQGRVHQSPRDPRPHSCSGWSWVPLLPWLALFGLKRSRQTTRPGSEGLPRHHWMMSHYRWSLLTLQCWGARGVPHGHERGSINVHEDSSLHVRIVHCSNYIVFPRP